MTDVRSRLLPLLCAEASLAAEALPVERLAASVGALPSDPSRLDDCVALLGDGLSGGLLYREVGAALLERLEQALPRLDADGRFALFAALPRIRPLESEHLVRYVRFGLDALGLVPGGDAHAVRDAWTLPQQRAIYLWSDAMRWATALQMSELAGLLAERGIEGDGGHVWDVLLAFLGYRGTVLLTPRQSPAVRHELEQMQRHDWLDMPWMFGAPDTTFVIDEVEDDSSPENMNDGGRIARSLMAQRAPSFDFFGKAFAWHPRQTLETALALAAEQGLDVIPAAGSDVAPRRLDRQELGAGARALQARAIRAMAAVPAGALTVDVSLAFLAHEEGDEAVFELSLTSTFGSDGKKLAITIALGDPEAILEALVAHGRLGVASLPRLLARLHPLSPSVRVACPDGPRTVVTAALARLWDPSVSGEAPSRSASQVVGEAPEGILGTWRGHAQLDLYDDPQPYVLELERDGSGVRAIAITSDMGTLELVGSVAEGRLALRQAQPGAVYVIDLAWNEEAGSLEGRFRNYQLGGRIALAREVVRPEPTAEELLAEVTAPWSEHVTLDLEALRFPGEREMLRALFDDPHFRTAYVESAANRAVRTEAMQLEAMLGRGAAELSRAMLPSAFRALDAVRRALGLRDEVRLWVHNDFTLNAFVTVDGGAITIHFTSGLLEVLTEVELEAAIGHELGHLLFGGHGLALRLSGTRMSGDARLAYLALRRHQELSADRLSLVACADPRAVFVVQTMLRTGIRKRDLFGGVDALIDAAREEVAALRGRAGERASLDAHPYSSLRIVALDAFARSSTFRALRPDAPVGEPLDDAAVTGELASLGRLLDVPRTAAEPADAAASVPRFLALAALRLVEADQSITVRELAALGALDPAMHDALRDVLAWTHERRDVAILDEARRLTRALAVPDREALLVRLLAVVRADSVVAYAETNVVDELGRLLEVETHTFRRTIDELYRGSR